VGWRSFLLAAGMTLVAAPARAEETLVRIRAAGVLRIGTDATYPPFEQKVGDRFEGFDIDLGNAIGELLGVRVEWINQSFDGIFAGLKSRKYDLVISDVVPTEERRREVAFSDAYYAAGQAVVVRADNRTIRSASDLPGHRVGVQLNTTGQFAAERIMGKENPGLQKYDTTPLALLDLAHGRLDAVVGDLPHLRYMIRRGGPTYAGLRVVGDVFVREEYAIACRKEDGDLLRFVNAALVVLRARGDYDRFYHTWLADAAEATPATAAGDAPAGARIDFRPGVILAEWRSLASGAAMTLRLTLLALMGGIPIGLALALARLSRLRGLAWLAAAYVEVMRGTPLLVQIFFIYYVLPAFRVELPQLATAITALSLNCAAYIAEIFRAGIQSIDIGQMEAARSLGLTYAQSMRHVILPQTFQRVLPPLTNEGIALLKDSSLVMVIALTELTRVGQELSGRYALPMTIWPAIGLLYLLLTLPLTRLAAALERRWDYLKRA